MIKLYSGGKTVKHAVMRPYDPGYYVIPKNTEYCYEPTEQTLLVNSEILFGFELSKRTYEYKTHDGGMYDIKDIYKNSVTVYMNHSEVQQMYDDPEKFWEVYIEGDKTIVNDEEVIIKNEEEYNKKKK